MCDKSTNKELIATRCETSQYSVCTLMRLNCDIVYVLRRTQVVCYNNAKVKAGHDIWLLYVLVKI